MQNHVSARDDPLPKQTNQDQRASSRSSLALPDSTRKYSERESGDTSIPNQFFWNVSGRGHVNQYSSRGRDTVPERAAVDAAKELGYDSLKGLQLAVIRGIVSWQECTHFPLFQKCE